MKMPENKLMRTLIYFFTVAGLLIISSIIIFYLWNNLIIKFNFNPITYLESVGINAIIYVFIYSILYGFFGVQSDLNFGNYTEAFIEKMNDQEKLELKNTLKKSLGDFKD